MKPDRLLLQGHLKKLRREDYGYRTISVLIISLLLLVLGTLIIDVLRDGLVRFNWTFLSSFPSRKPEQAGILAALGGSIYLIMLTASISTPIGVGAALYLEEYSGKNRFTKLIELNIANLAGVPSIIYGLLGLEIFARMMRFDRSLLAGACTMSLLILPIIIIASREAIQSVPSSIREASYALGANKMETIIHHIIPCALPGILTGNILAISRAMGETAPLIAMGALTYVAFVPDGLFSPFTVLPIQIFNWISRPQASFHVNAATGILVLLLLLLTINSVAIWIRARYQVKK